MIEGWKEAVKIGFDFLSSALKVQWKLNCDGMLRKERKTVQSEQ